MRILAILSVYNEERFIAACLDHLTQHGIEAYIIDNCSTDNTRAIVEAYRGKGVSGVESFPQAGWFDLPSLLRRTEILATQLDADWFIHHDADEFRLPPNPGQTLAEALTDVDAAGYNAVNFLEFTFIPTREEPNHDHADFQQTMRWYYPFLPRFPHRLNAWKRQSRPVELAWSGGHEVRFPEQRMYPQSFVMRHYQFVSIDHLLYKCSRWRGNTWRTQLTRDTIRLPSYAQLRPYISDDQLDPSNPWLSHSIAPATHDHTLFSGPTVPAHSFGELGDYITMLVAQQQQLEKAFLELEAYALSLEAEREQHQHAFKEVEAYARSLEAEREQHQHAFKEVEAYARSLEAERSSIDRAREQ